jgi:hypothetical protein
MPAKMYTGLSQSLSIKKASWEHTAQISQKIQETRAQLSPTKVVQQRIFLLSGLAFVLGFALGYRGVPVEEFGKPAARAVLTTVGKEAATRAIRGK